MMRPFTVALLAPFLKRIGSFRMSSAAHAGAARNPIKIRTRRWETA
jgi:hypothetical protein